MPRRAQPSHHFCPQRTRAYGLAREGCEREKRRGVRVSSTGTCSVGDNATGKGGRTLDKDLHLVLSVQQFERGQHGACWRGRGGERGVRGFRGGGGRGGRGRCGGAGLRARASQLEQSRVVQSALASVCMAQTKGEGTTRAAASERGQVPQARPSTAHCSRHSSLADLLMISASPAHS